MDCRSISLDMVFGESALRGHFIEKRIYEEIVNSQFSQIRYMESPQILSVSKE